MHFWRIISKDYPLWWYLGLVLFLLIGLGAGIGSFKISSFWDSIYGIIDWLAASVLYFFYGASAGILVYKLFGKRKEELTDWFYYTLFIVVLGIILIWYLGVKQEQSFMWYYLAYPFHYGVFFSGFTFVKLFGDLLISTFPWGKLVLDLVFLAMFGMWVYLSKLSFRMKLTNKQLIVRRLLLAAIFIIFTIGIVNCTLNLSFF